MRRIRPTKANAARVDGRLLDDDLLVVSHPPAVGHPLPSSLVEIAVAAA